jgi:iron complex outermembrane receptor protein
MERRVIRAVLAYLGLLIFGYALGMTAPVFAEPHRFDIPAGAADETLEEFGSQGGLTVTYNPELVKSHRTRAVAGRMEPVVALRSMLHRSGLRFTAVDPTTFSVTPSVRRLRTLLKSVKAAVTPLEQSTAELPQVEVIGHTGDDVLEPFGISGSRMSRGDRQDAGIETASEWLLAQPANSGSAPSEWTSAFTRDESSNTAFQTAANFHGLGAGDTLVLVNGHRLALGGSLAGYTDIGTLPLSAVSDIVVLHDGTSPIYGTDAIGGIVDFVLNRGDLEAPESPQTMVRTGSFGETQLSQAFDLRREGGSGLVTFEYYSRNPLPASDRSQATSDYRAFGGPNLDTPFGSPGTIVDALQPTSVWGIPAGQNGIGLSAASLIAGQPNLYNRNLGATLLPKERRVDLVGTGEQQVTDDTTIYSDVLLARRWVWAQAPGLTETLPVPATNAFYVQNVAGGDPIDVQYSFGNDVGPLTTQGRVDSGQLVAGFDHKSSAALSFQGYFGYAFESEQFT